MLRTDTAYGGLPTRRVAMFLTVLLVAALVAACATQGTGDAGAAQDERGLVGEEPVGAEAADGLEDTDAGSGGEATTGDGPENGDMTAVIAQQRIIKTGEISLEVERVATAVAEVRALATRLGGYVGDSHAGTVDESATLTLRIPADRFADALVALHELGGEVIAEATREEDVTTQIVDLEARIANLEASEASYRVLLERAQRIDDVLAVQSRLDEVRMQIEQLKAQLENVTGRADLSTLTVTLVPQPTPVQVQADAWDPQAELDGAIASLVGIGQALLTALIWFAVVWLPILLVLALFALLALRGVLEVRRRAPTPNAD